MTSKRESEASKQWRLRNKERLKMLYQNDRQNKIVASKDWAKRNPEKVKGYRHALKLEVINRYSDGKNCCNICGIPGQAFLTVDHINGGGGKHMREIGGSGKFYYWLRRNNYPKGFQILCWNCNMVKKTYGEEYLRGIWV